MAKDQHADLLDLTLCSFAAYIIAREHVSAQQARLHIRTALLATVTSQDTPQLLDELQSLIDALLSPAGDHP